MTDQETKKLIHTYFPDKVIHAGTEKDKWVDRCPFCGNYMPTDWVQCDICLAEKFNLWAEFIDDEWLCGDFVKLDKVLMIIRQLGGETKE